MTYEQALEYEQRQQEESHRIAEDMRYLEQAEALEQKFREQVAEMSKRYGPDKLCACGMKRAQDCDCPF
jgi:hypothetical protein